MSEFMLYQVLLHTGYNANHYYYYRATMGWQKQLSSRGWNKIFYSRIVDAVYLHEWHALLFTINLNEYDFCFKYCHAISCLALKSIALGSKDSKSKVFIIAWNLPLLPIWTSIIFQLCLFMSCNIILTSAYFLVLPFAFATRRFF